MGWVTGTVLASPDTQSIVSYYLGDQFCPDIMHSGTCSPSSPI